jgi:hypothetical protein
MTCSRSSARGSLRLISDPVLIRLCSVEDIVFLCAVSMGLAKDMNVVQSIVDHIFACVVWIDPILVTCGIADLNVLRPIKSSL